MFKLVAIDLDGTLLDAQGNITDNTLNYLLELKSKGVKVIISTGRPLYSLYETLEALKILDEDDYVISFNGALVSKFRSKKIIYEEIIPYNDFLEIDQLSKELNIDYHIQSDQGIFITRKNVSPFTLYDSKLNKTSPKYRTIKEMKNISIHKIMFVDSESYLDNVVQNIPREFHLKYNLMKSLDCFFEFLNINASKGLALQLVANKMSISRDQIIAIGDNENDLSMFEYAGKSIAMGNACKKLKEKAHFITKTNDNEGVLYALNKYF